jgi:hypothetical protein
MQLQHGRFKALTLQPGQALSQARIVLANPFGIFSFGGRVFTKASLHIFNQEAFPYVCPQSFLSILEVPRFRDPTK